MVPPVARQPNRPGGGAWSGADAGAVEHVRDVRTELMLKLALLDRAGVDPTELLRGQLRLFARFHAADFRLRRVGHDDADPQRLHREDGLVAHLRGPAETMPVTTSVA